MISTEAQRAYQREYYRAHRDKALAYQREYYQRHKQSPRRKGGRRQSATTSLKRKTVFTASDILRAWGDKAEKIIQDILAGRARMNASI